MKNNNYIKSLSNEDLAVYISRQINNIFPDNSPVTSDTILQAITLTEPRAFKCFSGIEKKYFKQNGITHFNHLISDQYCMYLYMLANTLYKESGNTEIPTKLYYLNKVLHTVDIYFTSELPEVFLFVHPLGTIIGRAKFHDMLVIYQGCTIGCLNEGTFPEFKGKCTMYANSKVLGNCIIGDNVVLAANCSIVNSEIPDNRVVLGSSPDLIIKTNNKDIIQRPPFIYGS